MEAEAGKRKAPEPSEPSAGEGLPESKWTKEQVAQWLGENGFEALKDVLAPLDGMLLLELTEARLKEYGGILGAALFDKLHPAEEAPGT